MATTQQQQQQQLLRQYTRKEVEETANEGKGTVMFILHDKVYDVTNFLNEHPGGEEVLLEHKGKESSEDFDDVGHSQDAMELMKKYLVGELVANERTNKAPKKGWIAGQYDSNRVDSATKKQVQGNSTPFYLLIALFVGVVAAVYYSCL